MGQGRNRLYFGISFLVSSIPAWAGIYCMVHNRTTLSILLIAFSMICMGISTLLFVGYKTIKHGVPLLSKSLSIISGILWPVARGLSRTRIVGPILSVCIRSTFFIWFMVLLMSDHAIRWVLRRFVGQHPTGHSLSVINAMDTTFELFDETIPVTKDLQDNRLFQRRKSESGAAGNRLVQRPRYSLPLAYTLSVASKLVYEDVAVIRYELEKAGFDVVKSFHPIAYQNICAFIVEKDNDILLVFRGTNPLNIQNYITNVNTGLCQVRGRNGSNMGKVHKGFWKAMGDPPIRQHAYQYHQEQHGTSNLDDGNMTHIHDNSTSRVQIVLNNTSLYRTIASAVQAVIQVLQFLTLNVFHYVSDPVDSSWTGPDVDVRTNTMFSQAEKHIMELLRHNRHDSKHRRLFITGHSLGGALGTIFLAKMVQSRSPVLEHFGGLYTFGHPKIGNIDFARSFDRHMSNKIFHHAYNNDIVTRIPLWAPYDSPPGTLVYIGSDYDITLYPPDPLTNCPVPIRRISFLHLSGVLNRFVIRRMVHENLIRILFRLVFPFFLNDHFPSDYCGALRHGRARRVVMGTAGLQGGEKDVHAESDCSEEDDQTNNLSKRYPNNNDNNINNSGNNKSIHQHQHHTTDIITLHNNEPDEFNSTDRRLSF
ncbi:Alpha/Beta hydrolase protein [Phascolomyces articulosus]|uniref:Alpha/Beta hydrolase protein n=1 Tax=Phascolomyces articulosus TaxID=60185 RepID=A0AAD5KIY0_9FUNG|nr:Alpha/Beta hydrolase protein [Phascolomyces articulosus]